MTRIFDALRKLQPAPAVPFAPAAPALQPVPGRATAAPRGEAAPPPVVESVTAASLAADVEREMAALRVGLESALEERATRVVLFMSSVGGEGTTSVASEFASLLAGDPRLRVVVVDLNARRPALAARFAPQGEPAARSREPGRAAARLGLARPGAGTPDAGIAPGAARACVTSLSGAFDWVILDGPAILESPEATDFATLADGVVLVVRAGHTKRPVVARAVDLLRKSGARVLGTVLNRRRLEIPDFLYRRI